LVARPYVHRTAIEPAGYLRLARAAGASHRRDRFADRREHGATRGLEEQPGSIAFRAGEGAAHVAEELALGLLGDGARFCVTIGVRRAECVQRPREGLLARARLALEQDRRRCPPPRSTSAAHGAWPGRMR
jgi:hypothetical protein